MRVARKEMKSYYLVLGNQRLEARKKKTNHLSVLESSPEKQEEKHETLISWNPREESFSKKE